MLGLDAFVGGIFGNAPLFERFYVGDLTDLLPDRVLDLNFDRRPAPNYLNTDIVEIRYGNYAAKLDAEYRVPIYRGTRSIYGVDLFGSFGVFGLANDQDFVDRARGYQGFGGVPDRPDVQRGAARSTRRRAASSSACRTSSASSRCAGPTRGRRRP